MICVNLRGVIMVDLWEFTSHIVHLQVCPRRDLLAKTSRRNTFPNIGTSVWVQKAGFSYAYFSTTLPKTNSSPLKMVVFQFGISFSRGNPYFQGLLMLVSGRVNWFGSRLFGCHGNLVIVLGVPSWSPPDGPAIQPS